jgi:hypothetical protein
LRSQFVEVPEMGPHDLQQWLDALGRHAGLNEITLDTECFERLGLIPNQPRGDRGGID